VERPVAGRHRKPGEAERRSQELAALVEHGLLDHLGRLKEETAGIVMPSCLAIFMFTIRLNADRNPGREVTKISKGAQLTLTGCGTGTL
jgi:hypothetical protein